MSEPQPGSSRISSSEPTSRRTTAEALVKRMARSKYAKWFIWLAVHLAADDADKVNDALGLSG